MTSSTPLTLKASFLASPIQTATQSPNQTPIQTPIQTTSQSPTLTSVQTPAQTDRAPKYARPRTHRSGRDLLKGQLQNFHGVSLTLYFTNSAQEENTLVLNIENGKFHIPDSLITTPQIVYLFFDNDNKRFRLPIALTHDYDLSLKANTGTLEFAAFKKNLEWSGHGSSVNKFCTETTESYTPYHDEPGKPGFDAWYHQSSARTDSLFEVCNRQYDRPEDPEFIFFKNIVREDMLFRRLDELMRYARKMLEEENPPDVEKYIHSNFDTSILKNISDSHYLASTSYRELMCMTYSYLFYIFKYDQKTHPDTTRDIYKAYLEKIEATFNGETRDFVLYNFIRLNLLAASNSYETFHLRTLTTIPFIDYIANKHYQTLLTTGIVKKEGELASLKVGDMAPAFSLKDKSGDTHRSTGLTGKIIVLDFWASWCSPCRHETPYLKLLAKKYETDNRVAFISIAVRDRKEAWLKALQEDKPDWLQLFDDEGSTARAYFTNGIPKFVVIDAQGKILNFEAPGPSDGNKLEIIIKKELDKM